MRADLNVVVAGGSTAGLFTSLLLARAGHTVTVLEQEALSVAPDVETAASRAFRSTAPHLPQPHIVLARCRELLIEYLPDVYANLLAAGVAEAPISTQMAPSLVDTAPRPGDERLTLLMTRRTTLDWVLQRTVRAEPRVQLRCGVRVLGLLTRPNEPLHVTGIRTCDETIAADLVVDATGGRTPVDRWLADIGAQPTATLHAECGIAYFSRHFRLRPGVRPPGPPTTRLVVGLDEFTAGIWGADNGVMQMAVAPLAKDHRFKPLRDPDVFTAVLSTIPFYARWLDALEPITSVFIMGAVQNSMRHFVVAGAPVVTGLVGIGDSVCTTNPTLGRGLSLALSGAIDLLKVLEHTDDRYAQALAMDELVCQHVLPYYQDQAAIDGARLAMMEHRIFNGPQPTRASGAPDRVTYEQLRTAALFDPIAFRAFWKIMGMITLPDELYTDAEVVAHTKAALDQHGSGPFIGQPTREQLVAALAK